MLDAVLGDRRGRTYRCLLLAGLVLTTSCEGSRAPNEPAAEVAEDRDGPDGDPKSDPSTGRKPPDDAPATPRGTIGPNRAQEAVEPREGAPAITSPQDDQRLGQNAFFYLNAKVPKLIIEIAAVRGFEPTDAAIDVLVRRLRSVADKPGGIEVLPVEVVDEGRASWSLEDVARFERAHRDVRNGPAAAVMHISYLDGESTEGALGVAYASSGAAIFAEDLRANALPTVPAVSAEKAALVHEVGHLLALVNVTYESPRDHHDEEHEGHSTNVNSVMYYAVDTIGVYTVFRGLNREPPTDFDADDRADLADLKSGKLP